MSNHKRFALLSITFCLSLTWLTSTAVAVSRGVKPTKWRDLFDGKTLEGWEKTNYGGEGEVEVQ